MIVFDKRIFQECLKKARVTPDYRDGNGNDLGNYQPTPLLTVISHIIEKSRNARLIFF